MEQTTRPEAHVHVENVGGISETDVTVPPGVTVLKGENATNRTSFLRSIMGALGSEKPSLKADAQEGRVELELDDETYTRAFERTGTEVRTSGSPYLGDATPADTFAFLLESNPARRAVVQQGDLREALMAPVDTTAIEAEITQKRARKSALDEELEELEALADRRPDLTERATDLEERVAEKREELEAIQAEIAAAETDPAETKDAKAELEAAFERVQELRADHSNVSDRLEAERGSLADARDELSELRTELESTPESVADRRAELESRLTDRRNELSRLEATVSDLQNLIQVNEDLLDGEGDVPVEHRGDAADVTDRLVESDTVTCWTCGSIVERSEIGAAIDGLREFRAEKLDRISALEAEIDEIQADLQDLETRASERRRLEAEIEDLEGEIETRSKRIDRLEERRRELEGEIEAAEAEIEELEVPDRHDELLDRHQEENRLRLEIDRLESDLADVESELADLEERLDRKAELEAEREAVTEALTELRTRVERLETEAVEEFNQRMEDLLGILGYGNVARIWIERREPGDGESVFDLHVVRKADDGTAYEDTIDHLSESEREVTGLVFALAGYLVHDVSETVPFMLLDSVEALDSNRIARLVEYFEAHVPYLVVALLPEDARALDDTYRRITEI
jgi:DNA repair exonuclease SbcCD ATPase subunit